MSLIEAIASGQPVDVIAARLAAGDEIGTMDDDGLTPLHHAIRRGRWDVVRLLSCAAANVRDKRGFTPLMLAIWRRDARMVDLLLPEIPDLDIADHEGNRAIHHAARAGASDICAKLIAGGAEATGGNESGLSPLHLAALGRHHGAAAVLSHVGTALDAVDANGLTALYYAAATGDLTDLGTLITVGAKTNPVACPGTGTHAGPSPLAAALLHHNIDAGILLVRHGAKLDAPLPGSALFRLAGASDYRWQVDILELACRQGWPSLIDALLDRLSGAARTTLVNYYPPGKDGQWLPLPAWFAVSRDHFACLKLLIDAGLDTEIYERHGIRHQLGLAGFAARHSEDLRTRELVLTPGQNVSSLVHDVMSPAEAALWRSLFHQSPDRIERTRAFLASTRRDDHRNDQGLTLLQVACLHQDEPLIALLLDAGADPNVQGDVRKDEDAYDAWPLGLLFKTSRTADAVRPIQEMILAGARFPLWRPGEAGRTGETFRALFADLQERNLPEIAGWLARCGADIGPTLRDALAEGTLAREEMARFIASILAGAQGHVETVTRSGAPTARLALLSMIAGPPGLLARLHRLLASPETPGTCRAAAGKLFGAVRGFLVNGCPTLDGLVGPLYFGEPEPGSVSDVLNALAGVITGPGRSRGALSKAAREDLANRLLAEIRIAAHAQLLYEGAWARFAENDAAKRFEQTGHPLRPRARPEPAQHAEPAKPQQPQPAGRRFGRRRFRRRR